MLLAIFTSFCLSAAAQITVTSATFPAAGDIFKTAVDREPALSDAITPPGGNQVWDFTGLKVQDTNETSYQPASAGAQVALFPGADMVQIGQASETFFNKTNNKVEVLGYAGADPANLGLNVVAKFVPPVPLRRSPMNFFDINQVETDLSLPFSTDALPDSLVPNIPFVDSIRIRIHYQRLDVVDGWGTVKIPGGSYPCLREKRTEYTTTNLDVHSSFLGWFEVGGSGGGGGGFLDFLGTDTTITHHFFSNTEKEEIAVLRLDNQASMVESATFKNNGFSPAPEINAPGSASISAYPNPAVDWVRFDCTNLPPNDYTLKIFNIVGKVVWKETYQLSGNKSLRVDLEQFKKGTYLYNLSDKKGNVISTKRLVVVKP